MHPSRTHFIAWSSSFARGSKHRASWSTALEGEGACIEGRNVESHQALSPEALPEHDRLRERTNCGHGNAWFIIDPKGFEIRVEPELLDEVADPLHQRLAPSDARSAVDEIPAGRCARERGAGEARETAGGALNDNCLGYQVTASRSARALGRTRERAERVARRRTRAPTLTAQGGEDGDGLSERTRALDRSRLLAMILSLTWFIWRIVQGGPHVIGGSRSGDFSPGRA